MRIGVLVALLAACLPTPALSTTLFTNGGPNAWIGGNELTAFVESEGFTLASDAVINRAIFWVGGYGGIPKYKGHLQYYFYDDASGKPGSILQFGDLSPTVVDVGHRGWCCHGHIYRVTFDFPDFAATAGVPYHLGLHMGALNDWTWLDVYWVASAVGPKPLGFRSDNPSGPWLSSYHEHAFDLKGTRSGAVVPEPTTWMTMILGMFGIGGALRRRKWRQQAPTA